MAAAAAANVELRLIESHAEIEEAFDVMVATWGEHQLVPSELFRAFQESGNVLQGAFAGDEMIGFSMGFYGRDAEGWHLHSHMVAVRPGLRSKGVGYALKLGQRAEVLGEGVSRIRWTYDPLISRNAYFNLGKLGAVADGFAREFYGLMDDKLNAGDRSDRLVIRWDVDRPPEDEGVEAEGGSVVLDRAGSFERPEPGEIAEPSSRPALVHIPREYAAIRKSDPELARRWRDAVAEAIEACMRAELVARSFTRDSAYVFS